MNVSITVFRNETLFSPVSHEAEKRRGPIVVLLMPALHSVPSYLFWRDLGARNAVRR